MRALLYALTALTFFAGIQLFVLAEHTDVFFSWAVAPPVSAAFIGAGFWSAATIVFWCSRQRDWALARIIIPTIAVVAVALLGATLQHLEAFQGLFGFAWVEIYAAFPPLLLAITARQLVVAGRDRHSGVRLLRPLRRAYALQASAAIVVGVLLFTSSSLDASLWPWELSPLSSKAIGTWVMGIGITAGVVALSDDRAAIPGWALSQVVLGATGLFAIARFAGDVDFADPAAYGLLGYLAATLISGAYGAKLALREGLYTPVLAPGAVPVELRFAEPPLELAADKAAPQLIAD